MVFSVEGTYTLEYASLTISLKERMVISCHDLNEPLSPKHNCVALSDNHAEVMIEIQQSGDLIFVFNKANFLDNTLKLFEV